MFSIFNDRPNTVNFQQENNITARKAGLTTKIPFADRKVNANVEEATALKTKPVKVVKEPESTPDIVDFYTCSYRDNLDLPNTDDNISSVVFGNAPMTPPPKNHNFSEPDFIEIGRNDGFDNYFDTIYHNIRLNNMLNSGFDQFDDSKMFEFDAVF